MEDDDNKDLSKNREEMPVKNNRKSTKRKFTISRLRKELTNKPEILQLFLFLKKCLIKKKKSLKKLKHKLEKYKNKKPLNTADASCQTEEYLHNQCSSDWKVPSDAPWTSETTDKDSGMSLADQVKAAAESALQQTGMVYEATSGMYYDYSTGYYYNAELGLYYHGTTQCYYYYDKDQNQFVFHSHPDRSQMTPQQVQHSESGQTSSETKGKHKKDKQRGDIKKRKAKDEKKSSEDGDSLGSVAKTKKPNPCDGGSTDVKINEKRKSSIGDCDKTDSVEDIDDDNKTKNKDCPDEESTHDLMKSETAELSDNKSVDQKNQAIEDVLVDDKSDLEEGEYSKSESGSDEDSSSSEDCSSTDSDESVAAQYPPCMRIIVQETANTKLKVGSLFLLTKDGGTLGREGANHSVIIPEENVSRHHLTFSYDEEKGSYFVVDMGSRNGTFLNGKRMSAAQQESESTEVVHGSVIQMGGTKLLCHIHSGNATCGHCEPGLLLQDSPPPETKEYRSSNIKKQHKKELRRLKIKYEINPFKEVTEKDEELLPEGYEDKARKRREKVGSQHHGAKTEQASVDESIASTNKGFKMLQKMGWAAGEGLGKDATGKQEPVPLLSNTGTSGLGLRPLSAPGSAPAAGPGRGRPSVWLAAQRRFSKLPAAKAFLEDEDSDDDGAKN